MQAATVSDYQGTTTRKAYTTGIAFPFTEKAIEALSQLTNAKEERAANFVSLVSEYKQAGENILKADLTILYYSI